VRIEGCIEGSVCDDEKEGSEGIEGRVENEKFSDGGEEKVGSLSIPRCPFVG